MNALPITVIAQVPGRMESDWPDFMSAEKLRSTIEAPYISALLEAIFDMVAEKAADEQERAGSYYDGVHGFSVVDDSLDGTEEIGAPYDAYPMLQEALHDLDASIHDSERYLDYLKNFEFEHLRRIKVIEPVSNSNTSLKDPEFGSLIGCAHFRFKRVDQIGWTYGYAMTGHATAAGLDLLGHLLVSQLVHAGVDAPRVQIFDLSGTGVITAKVFSPEMLVEMAQVIRTARIALQISYPAIQ